MTTIRTFILTLLACTGWSLWHSNTRPRTPARTLTIDSLRPGHSTRQVRWNTPDMKFTRGTLHFCVAGGYSDRDVLYDRGLVKAIKSAEIEINSKRYSVRGSSVPDLQLKLGQPTEECARQLIYRFPDYELLVRLREDGGRRCEYVILAERLGDLDPRWITGRV